MSPGVRGDDMVSPGGIHVSNSFGNDNLLPISREGSLMRSLKPSRANVIMNESAAALEQLNNEIVAAQERLSVLVKSAGAWSHCDAHSTTGNVSPATKKDRKKFVLRRRKNKSTSSTGHAEAPASASMSESESGDYRYTITR